MCWSLGQCRSDTVGMGNGGRMLDLIDSSLTRLFPDMIWITKVKVTDASPSMVRKRERANAFRQRPEPIQLRLPVQRRQPSRSTPNCSYDYYYSAYLCCIRGENDLQSWYV